MAKWNMCRKAVSSGFFERVWAIVARIPKGKVASYGQIAAKLGNPRAARTVGWAMNSLPEGIQIPWHRVINSKGRISRRNREHEAGIQRMLLEAEGVEFDIRGNVDITRYQWRPEIDEVHDYFGTNNADK